jgi:hypothetical protein
VTVTVGLISAALKMYVLWAPPPPPPPPCDATAVPSELPPPPPPPAPQSFTCTNEGVNVVGLVQVLTPDVNVCTSPLYVAGAVIATPPELYFIKVLSLRTTLSLACKIPDHSGITVVPSVCCIVTVLLVDELYTLIYFKFRCVLAAGDDNTSVVVAVVIKETLLRARLTVLDVLST